MIKRKRQEYIDTCLIYENLLENPSKNMNDSELKIYKQMLSSFSVAEINNAHSIATFWNKIADNKYIMHEIMHGGNSGKK